MKTRSKKNKRKLIQADYLSLNGKGWLNDRILNEVFECINEYTERCPVIQETSVASKMLHQRTSAKGHTKIWKKIFEAKRFTLLPINLENVHWLLACIRSRGKCDVSCSIMDSMESGNTDEVAERIRKSFNTFVKETDSASIIKIKFQPSVQQYSSFVCADSVISNALALTMGHKNIIAENSSLRKQLADLLSAEDE